MASTTITTYYLFRRPQDGTNNILYGAANGGESVYVKANNTVGAMQYNKVTDGEPWILVTLANSIDGIIESAKILARQVGVDNVMITKHIAIEQEMKLQ